VPVHPAAELFPPMSAEDLRELADDIKANGLALRIVLWEETDGRLLLLDGRNRLDAIELIHGPIGKAIAEAWRKAEASGGSKYTTLKIDGHPIFRSTEAEDPFDYVLTVNIHRRHLAGEERIELVKKLVKADPTMSARRAAKLARVSPTTGARAVGELEASGDVSPGGHAIDSRGRLQPRHKPPKPYKPQVSWAHPSSAGDSAPAKAKKKYKRDTSVSLDDIVATVGEIYDAAAEDRSAYDARRLHSFLTALEVKAVNGLGLPQCLEVADEQRHS
jgi:hypothetical protein